MVSEANEPGSESGKRSDDRRGAARGTRAGRWAAQEGGAGTPPAAAGLVATQKFATAIPNEALPVTTLWSTRLRSAARTRRPVPGGTAQTSSAGFRQELGLLLSWTKLWSTRLLAFCFTSRKMLVNVSTPPVFPVASLWSTRLLLEFLSSKPLTFLVAMFWCTRTSCDCPT